MASAGAAIWLQGIKTFFMESSTVRDCESTTTTKRYSHSVRFSATELFVCRLEKHERALSVLTEESYAQEITLIGYFTIHQ